MAFWEILIESSIKEEKKKEGNTRADGKRTEKKGKRKETGKESVDQIERSWNILAKNSITSEQ